MAGLAQKKTPITRRKNTSIEIDTRRVADLAHKTVRKSDVVGFGCPAVNWPHHVRVIIPASRSEDIRIVEDFGILGHASGKLDEIERCVISRQRWNALAETAKQDLNLRLREKKLPTSRWQTGDNKIERILGTELLTLAWAVSHADEADVAAVIATWVSLQSVERLWLAGRVLANPNERVMMGLSLLLSAGPNTAHFGIEKASPSQKGIGGLPLFEEKI